MDQLTNSIKAKLYESFTTSFMASFFISLLIVNHKYLLIYFSTEQDIINQLSLLSIHNLDYLTSVGIPFSIAIFYTVLFPFVNMGLLYISEVYKKKYTDIKIKAHEQIALNPEKARELRKEIIRLNNIIIEQETIVSTLEINSQKKVQEKTSIINEQKNIMKVANTQMKQIKENNKTMTEQLKELDKCKEENTTYKDGMIKITEDCKILNEEKISFQESIRKFQERNEELAAKNSEYRNNVARLSETERKNGELTTKLITISNNFQTLNKEKEELNKDNKKLINKLLDNSINLKFKNKENLSPDEIQALTVLYNQNYVDISMDYNQILSNLTKWMNIKRVLMENILTNLFKKQYLDKDGFNRILITKKGKTLMLDIANSVEGEYK